MIRSHPPTAWEPQDHSAGGYLDAPLCTFLDQIAAREPAPGGGAAAAMAVAMAAALTAMAARFAATDLCTHAEMLRARVAPLAQADASAYQQVISLKLLPGKPNTKAAKARHLAIRKALDAATEIPLRVAEAGADVAKLAAVLARDGNPNLRGDAATAGQLAAAGARAAATLVAINVGDHGGGKARVGAHQDIRLGVGDADETLHLIGGKVRPVGDPDRTVFEGVDRVLVVDGLVVVAAGLGDRVVVAADRRVLLVVHRRGDVVAAEGPEGLHLVIGEAVALRLDQEHPADHYGDQHERDDHRVDPLPLAALALSGLPAAGGRAPLGGLFARLLLAGLLLGRLLLAHLRSSKPSGWRGQCTKSAHETVSPPSIRPSAPLRGPRLRLRRATTRVKPSVRPASRARTSASGARRSQRSQCSQPSGTMSARSTSTRPERAKCRAHHRGLCNQRYSGSPHGCSCGGTTPSTSPPTPGTTMPSWPPGRRSRARSPRSRSSASKWRSA